MNDIGYRWGMMMEVAMDVAIREGAQAAKELRERWTEAYYRRMGRPVETGAETELRIE